jgi:acyl-CoA thioesterase-1
MCHVRKVWLGLLLLLTAVVSVGVAYVIVHKDPVQGAGDTPGYSAPASSPVTTTPATASSSTRSSSRSATAPAAARVVFLGDDYTLGVGASSPSNSWTTLVADTLHLAPTIVGESGAGYAKHSARGKTYASLVDKVVGAKPDLIVVSGGRNDVSDDPDTLRTAAKALFAELHSKLPEATLLAIAPWWGDSPHPNSLDPVDGAVRSGVQAAGGTYLEPGDPLAGHPSFMADDAHPNDKGYRAIADTDGAAIAARLPR